VTPTLTPADPDFFRLLVERVQEYAIYGLDVAGRIASWNDGAERIKGYSTEEIVGQPYSVFFPAEEVEKGTPGRLLREAVLQGQVEDVGWRVRKDGTRFWADAVLTAMRDASGQLVGFAKVTRDLTEQEMLKSRELELMAEREARRSETEARQEAQLRAQQEEALRKAAHGVTAAFSIDDVIREIAGNALAATDADGAFVKQIDQHHRLVKVVARAGEVAPDLGITAPYNGSFTELVMGTGQPVIVPSLKDATRSLPDQILNRCGACSAMIVPLMDGERAIGTLAVIRYPYRQPFRPEDMDRARAFADLASLAFRRIHLLEDSATRMAELERVMESRARLIRGFSHDVRNPLSAASGYLELITTGVVSEPTKQQDFLGRAGRAIESAVGLLSDLVEFGLAESGQIDVRACRVDLRALAEEVAQEYRAQAEAKRLTIAWQLPPDFPSVVTDPARVRQILGNLISNAVKYTPAGGIEVVLSGREDGHGRELRWATLSVSDTGSGIAEGSLAKVFQEFTRLAPAAAEGAGLGLAISQRVAEALGGRITVDSELGRGSTFTLWLPLER
jgi:PAS domain S-box-containing protein